MRRAFSLVELMIAMALGTVIAYLAYAAFSMAVQTVATVNRLSLENDLMRAGMDEAMDDADYWTSLDDPLDPAATGLRTVAARDTWYGSQITQGRLFTPLAACPVLSDVDTVSRTPQPFGPTAWQTRPGDPQVESAADLADDDRVLLRDLDRGWDAWRPYQANDPRWWYRGNAAVETHAGTRMGRYALFANKRRYPVLGFGDDQRDLIGWSHLKDQLEFYSVSGPYGPYDNWTSIRSRTYTWYDHQVTWLFDSLGLYGLCEYLPSNAFYASHGADLGYDQAAFDGRGGAFKTVASSASDYETGRIAGTIFPAVDGFVRCDERIDIRFAAARRDAGAAYEGDRGSRGRFYAASIRQGPYLDSLSLPILPWSDYTGLYNVAVYSQDGSIAGDNGRDPNTSLTDAKWAAHHRYGWYGDGDQPYAVAKNYQRGTLVLPLLPQRPDSWPNLQLLSMRMLLRSHFQKQYVIRWTNQRTNETAELSFQCLGSTLRGARQQRHRDGGWAAWHGPGEANDPTLDSPP